MGSEGAKRIHYEDLEAAVCDLGLWPDHFSFDHYNHHPTDEIRDMVIALREDGFEVLGDDPEETSTDDE